MDDEPVLFSHDTFLLLIEKSGEFTQLCGSTRCTWIGRCNPGDVLVTLGHVEEPLLRPTLGEQLLLREIADALDDLRRLPAEELAGLSEV